MLLETLEGLLVNIPMGLGKLIANAIKNKPWYWTLWIFVILAALAAASFLTVEHVKILDNVKSYRDLGWLVPLLFLVYLFLTAPLFFVLASTKSLKMNKGLARERKYKFSSKQMSELREKAAPHEVFLGISMTSRRSCYLHTETRRMHCHVVGSTGCGKTDSLILPLLFQDMEQGRGALLMDAKGDMETFEKIHRHIQRIGREKDFFFFSLAYPQKSNTYNPLFMGNPTELKDKIISSNIWTEEFYKSKAEEALLMLLKGFRDIGETVTFQKIYELLCSSKKFVEFSDQLKDKDLQRDMMEIIKRYPAFQDELAGLKAVLGSVAQSEFAHLLVEEKPQIDLLNAYQKKQIVYFQLNTQGYQETAKRFGRIVLQDLKAVSNHIQSYIPEKERSFFPIFVDEFSNFAYEEFIEFLNKARGAHLGLTIAHQSLGDLQKVGDYFMKQILENCNIKIVMRQDDPQSIEIYSRISGTEKTFKDTQQVQEDFVSQSPTGMGTIRVVEEFRLKPNTIRELARGETGIILKQPLNFVDIVQLDYIDAITQGNAMK